MRVSSCSNPASRLLLALMLFSSVSALGCRTAVDVPYTPTIWAKLGIPQAIGGRADNRRNRRGNNPQRERKPPLKRIADPENLESPNKAIKAAAEIKQQEDLAPQKIKALKYLAEIGCGCYDKDGKVEAAILEGLADCTEDVRMTAVETVIELATNCDADAAYGSQGCTNKRQKRRQERQGKLGECAKKFSSIVCGRKDQCQKKGGSSCCGSCCTAKIAEYLSKMAYEEECGCWFEPSAAVRAKAREALGVCPCPRVDCPEPEETDEEEDDEEDEETKTEVDPESQTGEEDGSDEENADEDKAEELPSGKVTQAPRQQVRLVQRPRETTPQPSGMPRVIRRVAATLPANIGPVAPASEAKNWHGVVEFLDPADGSALIVFKEAVNFQQGKRLNCLVAADGDKGSLKLPCQVVHAGPGMIAVQPLNATGKSKLRPGVRIVVGNQQAAASQDAQAEASDIKLISDDSGQASGSVMNPFRPAR